MLVESLFNGDSCHTILLYIMYARVNTPSSCSDCAVPASHASSPCSFTAVYATLGCKLNFAETASLSDALQRMGIRPAQAGEKADVCVVNTCSVTDTADHKCRQTIHRLRREHPAAPVVVIGCYAQLQPQTIATIDGVALVLGMERKGQAAPLIADLLGVAHEGAEEVSASAAPITIEKDTPAPDSAVGEAPAAKGNFPWVPSCSRGDRTRYFLKVQDGCNYFCTYCTIPIARGRSRNGSIASLVAQAEEVAQKGGREIVITGVNIGDFGRSTGEHFLDLLRALDGVEGIKRYRISSIEPNLLTDEVIDFCAHSRAFMPHFHIPLQSGSDEVLRLMHRRYDTALFRAKVDTVLRYMPDAFIGVDVIVGTRGETASYFDAAEAFIRSLPIAQLHVFSYSERPGTRALEIPHVVSPAEKHARSQRLLALSAEKHRAFLARYVGQTRPVLWEHARGGAPLSGFTDNYLRVQLLQGAACDNEISLARLTALAPSGEALLGCSQIG